MNQQSVKMNPSDICQWLCGSNTNSASDFKAETIISQTEINSDSHIVFPLAGREESIEHLAKCFSTTYDNRLKSDRNTKINTRL